jgi:hypothetical protein
VSVLGQVESFRVFMFDRLSEFQVSSGVNVMITIVGDFRHFLLFSRNPLLWSNSFFLAIFLRLKYFQNNNFCPKSEACTYVDENNYFFISSEGRSAYDDDIIDHKPILPYSSMFILSSSNP